MIRNTRFFYGNEARIGVRILRGCDGFVSGVNIVGLEDEYEDIFFLTDKQAEDIQKKISEYLQQKCMQKVKTQKRQDEKTICVGYCKTSQLV